MTETAQLLHDLKSMLLIRRFEEKIEGLFTKGLIHGTTHLCTGQEAIPVGISGHLTSKDLTLSNHRGHGHFMARGAEPFKLFAELLGRVDGYCRGRGGTQHLSCIELGHLGSNGITAGSLPIAVGAAFTQKYNKTSAIVVPYFGDGAVGEGAWHEAMNMASIWKLPVLFVCENNLYAMSTPTSKGISGGSIAAKASNYDIPWREGDGNDICDVKNLAGEMIAHIRAGNGPAFLELKTYRQVGHSKSDMCDYRTREEENKWKLRDPILLLSNKLRDMGVSNDTLDKVEKTVQNEIDTGLIEAQKSPFPDVSEAMKDIYA